MSEPRTEFDAIITPYRAALAVLREQWESHPPWRPQVVATATCLMGLTQRPDVSKSELRVLSTIVGQLAMLGVADVAMSARPPIVCLCGSSRFRAELVEANRHETMAGKIVLAPGVFGHDGDLITDAEKAKLDRLHFAKINLADEVLVVNPGGYIGDSTRREIEHTKAAGKPLRYTEGGE